MQKLLCWDKTGWLWAREAKISFEYSRDSYARIVIDGMNIPLIKENSNKDSSTKNNLPISNPSQKDIEDIIRFIIRAVEKDTSHHIVSDSHKYQHCHTGSHRKKRKNGKAKVARTISVSESESSVSDSSNSSHI